MGRGALLKMVRIGVALLALAPWLAWATVVPRLTLEDLVDASDRVVQGRVVASWTAWDQNHRYIWTHYRIRVAEAMKGGGAAEIVISEPGGSLDGQTLLIADAVAYTPGEEVIVFTRRVPAGYLRTTGYGQGKYSVRNGRVANHATRLTLAEPARKAGTVRAQTPLDKLNGIPVADFKARVRALISSRPAPR